MSVANTRPTRPSCVAAWVVRAATAAGLAMGFASLAVCGARAEPKVPSDGFHVVASTLIGGEGSWDYLRYDGASHRLFLSRVGGVLVVDSSDMKPIGSIPAFAGTRVFGIALAPELGLGVLSAGTDKAATVFDLRSLGVTRRVRLPHAPDDILVDTFSRTAIAFGGEDPVAMAFDPATGGLIANIDLPGSPESPVSDGKGAIYVDLSDTGEVARINTKTWKVDSHWPIGGSCKEPTPMAIDRRQGLVFIGCRSGVLAVVDVVKQALVATMPIGAGADTVVFDDRSGLIFVSCNDGTLSIFKATSPVSFALVQTVPTAVGARTMTLDPDTMRVFLPVADRGPMLPKVGDIPSRPAIVPETFRILTVAR